MNKTHLRSDNTSDCCAWVETTLGAAKDRSLPCSFSFPVSAPLCLIYSKTLIPPLPPPPPYVSVSRSSPRRSADTAEPPASNTSERSAIPICVHENAIAGSS